MSASVTPTDRIAGGPQTGQSNKKPTVSFLRRLLIGKPLPSSAQEHTRLPKILALPVFASDAISSSVYATQEILLALSVAGAAALAFTSDPLDAVLECRPGDLDELEAIISWVNDPAIWGWPT